MQFKTILAAAFSAITASAATTSSFPTIDVVGNKFFYSNNGSQFYIKGVAYQKNTANSTSDASFVDPLADTDTCERDIPYLQELGTNVIRVYAVNASLDHDTCMQKLQDAGIYVIADLSEPDLSISTTDPEWTVSLYNRYTEVIDMFQQYDNVLGFFAGNEVITNSSNTDSAPFVKAAIRDMKAYISDSGYRDIPIGYSANDDADTRVPSADFFSCGDNDVVADFYGINMYEWCGNATFANSGYEDRTEEFSNLTIPVFFSEYGCNAVQPREFTEVAALYSDEMTDVWSGGIVYMYFEETNNYGLVTIESNGDVSTLEDFNNLKTELADISPTYATASSASAEATTLECPATGAYWKAATELPPTPDESVCNCISEAAQCVVSDDVDESDYGDFFGIICDYVDCSDISADGSTGEYGAYSFCSPKDQLNYLLNMYYVEQDSSDSACDFSGSASLQSSTSVSSCSAVLSSASAAATATGSSGSGSSGSGSSGSSDSSSDSSSSSGASSTASSSSGSSGGAGDLKPVFKSSFEYGFASLALVSVFFGGFGYLLF